MVAQATDVVLGSRLRGSGWYSAVVLCWCALMSVWTGCKADPNMQLVERELRLQDDRIFELEEHLADCHNVVARQRRELASLRRRLDEEDPKKPLADDSDALDAWGADRKLQTPGELALPQIEEGAELPAVPQSERSELSPSLDSPSLDLEGDESEEAGAAPPPFEPGVPAPDDGAASDSMSHPRSIQTVPIHADSAPEELPPPELDGTADDVSRLDLHRSLHYHTADGVPLEMEALLDPRDVDSQQVRVPGEVSLMLVDMNGDRPQQLARWEFPADEVRHLWRHTQFGTGMHIRLTWPEAPQAGAYRLWARLVGDDGRKHLARTDFEVDQTALANKPEPTPQVASTDTVAEDQPETKALSEQDRGGDEKEEQAVSWRPSVEAARLPPMQQPYRLIQETAKPGGTSPASEFDPFVAWSPDRPPASAKADAQTATAGPEWSPYR